MNFFPQKTINNLEFLVQELREKGAVLNITPRGKKFLRTLGEKETVTND